MNEITLKNFFNYLKNKVVLVIIIIILTLLFSFVYYNYKSTSLYKSSNTILIINDIEIKKPNEEDILILNKDLTNVCDKLIYGSLILDKVINELNLDLSVEELSNNIELEINNRAETVKIIVKDKDSKMSSLIANSISKNFIEYITKLYDIKNIEIIDESQPVIISNINIRKFISKTLIIVILLPLIVIFTMYYIDPILKDKKDLDKLKLKILGIISKINDVELIKKIRLNIEENLGNNKLILITSSTTQKEKASTSSLLAHEFSNKGYKTLLIDADLRNNKLKNTYNLNDELGLSLLLTIEDKKINNYIHKTDIDNLYFIPSGKIIDNASTLLETEFCKKTLQDLKKEYDIIIVDSCPIKKYSDSLILSKVVDTSILVCSLGITNMNDLMYSRTSLEQINSSICGLILNDIKENKK